MRRRQPRHRFRREAVGGLFCKGVVERLAMAVEEKRRAAVDVVVVKAREETAVDGDRHQLRPRDRDAREHELGVVFDGGRHLARKVGGQPGVGQQDARAGVVEDKQRGGARSAPVDVAAGGLCVQRDILVTLAEGEPAGAQVRDRKWQRQHAPTVLKKGQPPARHERLAAIRAGKVRMQQAVAGDDDVEVVFVSTHRDDRRDGFGGWCEGPPVGVGGGANEQLAIAHEVVLAEAGGVFEVRDERWRPRRCRRRKQRHQKGKRRRHHGARE